MNALPPAGENALRCEQCGASLESSASDSGCLNCLLCGGLSDAPNETNDGRGFQHYELCLREDGATFHELGRGAMGITYLAADVNLDALVALKVINERYSRQPEARARFRREARAAAQLRHPNVASVFHFGETPGGKCFYAMELVEGETLEDRVRRDGPLPLGLALEIAAQIARALVAAEAQGLVHRDLKPSNVMALAHDSAEPETISVKVIDFGLARLVSVAPDETAPAGFSGTPGFASPEQLVHSDDGLDPRSDIYSLGATLFYLLSGKTPADVPPAITAGMPSCVASLLRSMLAAEPGDRPQNARELLTQLQRCRITLAAGSRRRKLLPFASAMITIFALGIFSLTNYFLRHHPAGKVEPPEKSIAVLPFANLSDDKENAFFASGVQDEILSNLAQIADLKVISRTSVMAYQSGAPRNLREIGQSLGVANILEGSVQRVGTRVRVVAQLIDARSDTHRWSKTYDRELADIFSIQDEIAREIAQELQAKIAPQEKALIAEKPTSDLVAYGFYERARNLPIRNGADLQARAGLLNEAIRRDPQFLLAYCLLGKTYANMSAWEAFGSSDSRETSMANAREVIDLALRLRPDRGEPRWVNAYYYFQTFQFPEARRELDAALRLLPNDAEAIFLDARLDRHDNRWDDALRKARRAIELDPQNIFDIDWTAETYGMLRRYPEGEEFVSQAKARNPATAVHFDGELAQFKLGEGDLPGALTLLRHPTDSALLGLEFRTLFLAKDYTAALRAITTAPPAWVEGEFYRKSPESSAEARIFLARGERAQAERIFRLLRAQIDQRSSPAYRNEWYYAECSRFDAALGLKEQAIHEAREAVDMRPVARDPVNGLGLWENLAAVYAATGERDLAIAQLDGLARIPSGIDYGGLVLDSSWDSLRGDPRFEKIVASLKPARLR